MENTILIRDGFVVDGSGNPWFRADVAVEDGKIAAIGDFSLAKADRVIDAKGLTVCPGFLDMHVHAESWLFTDPKCESRVRQGVTTEVVGGCGKSAAPVKEEVKEEGLSWQRFATITEFLDTVDKATSVNIATQVGHSTVRGAAMGADASKREPTKAEMDEMKALVAEAMEDGAFGLSCMTEGPIGNIISTEELIGLCRVVAKYGGIHTSHQRNEREKIVEATKENVEIGEKAGLRISISHHLPRFGGFGKHKETLKVLEEARARGVETYFDDWFAFSFAGPMPVPLLPWVLEGGTAQMLERLKDPKVRERLKKEIQELGTTHGAHQFGMAAQNRWDLISLYPRAYPSARALGEKNASLAGKTFDEIGKLRKTDPFDLLFDLIIEEEGEVGLSTLRFTQEDARDALPHPLAIVTSDGVVGDLRTYATFPKVIEQFVRKEKVLTLEEAIRKMTSLPAEAMRILDRGLLREGMWADIVIFNQNTIGSKADLFNPAQYPDGIEYVIVNGQLTVEKGEHIGTLAGKALRWKKA